MRRPIRAATLWCGDVVVVERAKYGEGMLVHHVANGQSHQRVPWLATRVLYARAGEASSSASLPHAFRLRPCLRSLRSSVVFAAAALLQYGPCR